MPLFDYKILKDSTEIGIWRIEEEEEYFLNSIDLYPEEVSQLRLLTGRRRKEWLSTRLLLHNMTGRTKRAACLKDKFGKPYIKDSDFHISISHTKGYAAVMASKKIIGIDIQKIVNKIENISHKFLSDEEFESIQEENKLQHLHVYWGAKECLYKAYGRRKLNFKNHIFISPFRDVFGQKSTYGIIRKDEEVIRFEIQYQFFKKKNYCLVYAIEI